MKQFKFGWIIHRWIIVGWHLRLQTGKKTIWFQLTLIDVRDATSWERNSVFYGINWYAIVNRGKLLQSESWNIGQNLRNAISLWKHVKYKIGREIYLHSQTSPLRITHEVSLLLENSGDNYTVNISFDWTFSFSHVLISSSFDRK